MRPARASPLVHLELHTGEIAGARSFYAELCGWPAQPVETGTAPYVAMRTGAAVGAGVVECAAPRPMWLPYVQVEEIGAATERASALGASVLLNPREGPAGWRSVVAHPGPGRSRCGSRSAEAGGDRFPIGCRRSPWMAEFAEKYGPALEAELEPGESLQGVCAANHRQSAFKGRLVAIGVTDRRLLVLGVDRRGDPTGVESISPIRSSPRRPAGRAVDGRRWRRRSPTTPPSRSRSPRPTVGS